MSDKLMRFLMDMLGIDTSDMTVDKDGLPSLKDWEENPQTRPDQLPGVKNDKGSKQFGRLMQIALYKLAKQQGKTSAQAKESAEGVNAVRRGSKLLLHGQPSSIPKDTHEVKSALLLKLGFKDGEDFILKDGIVQPKDLEIPLQGSKDSSTSVLRTIAYLHERKNGKSVAEARQIAEGVGATEAIFRRLHGHGQGDRSRFKDTGKPPPKKLDKKVDKVLKKVEDHLAKKGRSKIRRNQRISDETLRQELVEAIKSGKKDAIDAVVTKYLVQDGEVAAAIKDNPQLQHEIQNLRDEQKKKIVDSMLDLVEAMESQDSDAHVQEKLDNLLAEMHDYIGNLEVLDQQRDIARQNRADGEAWEDEVASKQSKTYREVYIQPLDKDGKPMLNADGKPLKVRMDIVKESKDRKLRLLECKNGPNAPLTPNQKKAFQPIEENGFIIIGGRPGLEEGSRHPPTKVEIVRPQNGEKYKKKD